MTEVNTTEIVDELLKHPTLKLQDKGEYLRKGECPSCGKRELFVRKSQPYRVMCGREQKCGYTESTRDLLPQLFTNYVERFPKSDDHPNATADAYLSHNRGFELIKIKGSYEQHAELIELEEGQRTYVEGIRFYLDPERTRWWSRLIDKTKKDGQKAHFAGKRKPDGTLYRGDVWVPPGMEIKESDKVFIVEGIFHAIAFWCAGFKAVAAFSCNNFPRNFIDAHKNKGVLWCIALDEGEAGRKYAKKFHESLVELKEKTQVYLPVDEKTDWDDMYRAGQLIQTELNECLYRGRLFMARDIRAKAYHWHKKTKRRNGILEHGNRLYMVKVPAKLEENLAAEDADLDTGEGREIFEKVVYWEQISNVYPTFLYTERDDVLDEQRYVFRIQYSNGSGQTLMGLDGSEIESPASFNKALLKRTLGGTFDGGAAEMKRLRDDWLNNHMKLVQSNPFAGYDRQHQVYVFQNFAFHKGREIPLNEEGYFQIGQRVAIKTSLKSVHIAPGKMFNPSWLLDLKTVFSWHGLATLAWWTASFFAEQIRAMHKSWPFFELTGAPGAGKSTLLEFMWKLSGRGMDYEGFDAMKSTPAGRRRVFNQLSGMPVALIESDRDDTKDAKKGGFHFDELKPLYNGRATGTLGVAKRGHDTEEPLFKGSLMIAQNATVDGSEALLSRIVHCHVNKDHHSPRSLQLARKFEQATADEMGGYLRAALSVETQFLEVFDTNFQAVEQEWIQAGEIKELRVIKCHAQVFASCVALTLLFPQITIDMLSDLKAFIYERAQDRSKRLVKDHPMVEQFWDTYLYLNERPNKEGAVYDDPLIEVLNHSNKENQVAINLNHYVEMCRKFGQEIPDLKVLKKLLPGSTRYRFIECTKVKSKQAGKTLHCWVFKEKE